MSSVRQAANRLMAITGADPIVRVENLSRGRRRWTLDDGERFESPHLAEEHLRRRIAEAGGA